MLYTSFALPSALRPRVELSPKAIIRVLSIIVTKFIKINIMP